MIRLVRRWGRGLLRSWAKTCRAHGYFYQAVEAYGARLAESTPLPAYLPNGSMVECDLRDHVQRQIYFQGVYEPVEAYVFTRLLRLGSVVIDAGANVGQYTLLAASVVGPSGEVHSFEPVPRSFDRLQRNVEANRVANARLNRVALWSEATELHFGLATEEVNDGSYSVGSADHSLVPVASAPALRMDDYARGNGIRQVDLIKMDIEGAEAAALQGMKDVIARDHPPILLEVNREACNRMNYDPEVFWTLLCERFGYSAWQIGLSAAHWRRLPSAEGVDRANVLFVKGELPESVTSGWDVRTCIRWGGRRGGCR
jgi:FkbM family methyltransferase